MWLVARTANEGTRRRYLKVRLSGRHPAFLLLNLELLIASAKVIAEVRQAGIETGLEVNTDKTEYMKRSRNQNQLQNQNLTRSNTSALNVIVNTRHA
jgi:hypothetical protein